MHFKRLYNHPKLGKPMRYEEDGFPPWEGTVTRVYETEVLDVETGKMHLAYEFRIENADGVDLTTRAMRPVDE